MAKDKRALVRLGIISYFLYNICRDKCMQFFFGRICDGEYLYDIYDNEYVTTSLTFVQAVNAYYAVYLYALATANVDLTHFSHLLLSMEVQAAQFYWHMPNDDIYDSVFAASRMAGNIGALDVTASTWFGTELEYVHGINL